MFGNLNKLPELRPESDYITNPYRIDLLENVNEVPEKLDVLIEVALGQEELDAHMELLANGDNGSAEFEDIRESALLALDNFLASCPQDMKPYTDQVVAAGLRFISFDPNYAADDDDEDMEDSDQDEDEDNDFDDDDFGDDDDTSWKVRRVAVKVLHTLIETRGGGDFLETGTLYSHIGPALIRRFGDRDESVRLEVISTLSMLIRKTEEIIFPTGQLEPTEIESGAAPTASRKRRRQSSNLETPISPVVSLEPAGGIRVDLARLSPGIVKESLKVLKGKLIPANQAVMKVLNSLVKARRGDIDDSFVPVVVAALNCLNTSGNNMTASTAAASGTASATPTTLKVTALVLIRDICRFKPSVLETQIEKIVSTLVSLIGEKFSKISSEAILTAKELVRSFIDTRSSLASSNFELTGMFDAIYSRVDPASNKIDTEVRQYSIEALGVLISRTLVPQFGNLLSDDRRHSGLQAIQARLSIETTKLTSIHTIEEIASFKAGSAQLEKSWIQAVMLELANDINKSKRIVRSASIKALKHLAAAAIGRMEPEIVRQVVTLLIPVVDSDDAYMVTSALWVWASFVQQEPRLMTTDEVSKAIVTMLNTRSASIALEPLLVLVSHIGKSGCGDTLMRQLLASAHNITDSTVYGRVIGSLLVAGGDSTGVSLDSFISELKPNPENDNRTALALTVLGEAGKQLGEKSPLDPNIFFVQFRPSFDRVSLAAAFALGRAGSGDVDKYLPLILEKLNAASDMQYLLILSLKEMLQNMSPDLMPHLKPIWSQLLTVANANLENRVVIAECLGRLVVLDSAFFMPKLQELLEHRTPMVRGLAIQAARYTLPESDEAFDTGLKSSLNKPSIVLPRMGDLVPFIIDESKIKPELVREIMMGPFKHKVDDGLEVRKSAYETLYALLDTAFKSFSLSTFYDRVLAGLSDDHDIRSLCNLMIIKLASIVPKETTRRLDRIATAYQQVLSVKLKEGAVKQEIEKQGEAIKGVIHVTMVLVEKLHLAQSETGGETWSEYWRATAIIAPQKGQKGQSQKRSGVNGKSRKAIKREKKEKKKKKDKMDKMDQKSREKKDSMEIQAAELAQAKPASGQQGAKARKKKTKKNKGSNQGNGDFEAFPIMDHNKV
ncbi:Cullin-associated NEDD8-dissociated protein 1 [Ceratocystis platani]|uniref:Cullin-associated NEDD8-dissociated protein 1 n=1 Tax=Ceratocystis fimbriata f. sp. platani TaxID=88771 RepID=A0A0F8B256_CERFI|nr:Cullin-associated NEDD8-dissociated protein 1 [Ceratocystis platani]